MRTPRTTVASSLLLLVAAVGLLGGFASDAPASSRASPAGAGRLQDSTFAYVAGTWDWAKGDSTCRGNTHTLAFSPDGKVMTLTFKLPLDSTDASRVTRYRILAVGPAVAPELSPYALRGAIEGETRRTPAGALVVWDLVLASPNRYHWHRTDWPATAVTGPIVRCDGTRPMEMPVAPTGGGSLG